MAAVVALLAVGLPRLGFVTGQDTMVDPGSDVYRVNERYQDTFGGEPMLDVLFALASTLILLPPLLVWADERHWLRIVHAGGEEAPKVPAETSGRR